MASEIQAGDVPATLDPRLERRDTSPLPPGALARFQRISRGKNPQTNYRWVLFEDGRLFAARHSQDTSDWKNPFDTPLPTEPTLVDRSLVEAVQRQLDAADFVHQEPYQADPGVEDGVFSVVTARYAGREHEVIYDAYQPPLVQYLASVKFS